MIHEFCLQRSTHNVSVVGVGDVKLVDDLLEAVKYRLVLCHVSR